MRNRNPTFIIDSDYRRRASLASMLFEASRHVAPFDTPEEIALHGATPDAVLVRDEGDYLPRTRAHMAMLGVNSPIVLYNAETAPERIVDAIHAGASDYVAYPIPAEKLLTRLDLTIERFVPEANRREVVQRARSSLDRLTMREREVVAGMAEGLTNKGIGKQLGISPRTVEIHRTNALGKLGVGHSAEAIRIAIGAEDPTIN